jgi:hypothetical protein
MGAFDRVINSFSLIALRSLGFSLMVTRIIGLTWRKRKCYIKTGFGISERYYQPSPSKQSIGLGQCSTAASYIWCVINRVFMHTLASSYIGFAMFSFSSKIIHKRIDECLIDDTGVVVSSQSFTEITSTCVKRFTPDENSLCYRMRRMIQFFLKLLQVAGGDLNISKCSCFTVFHFWKGGRAMLLRTHDSHQNMNIAHPSYGELKHITCKNPNEVHRALGWMATTDGKSTAQLVVSRDKAKLFAGGILQSRMQLYDASTS